MGLSDKEFAEIDLKPGKTLIRTDKNLHSTAGMFVTQDVLDRRKADTEGILWSYVPGHGGDVWWVVHQFDDQSVPIRETVSVYGTHEFVVVANLETIEPGTDFLKRG